LIRSSGYPPLQLLKLLPILTPLPLRPLRRPRRRPRRPLQLQHNYWLLTRPLKCKLVRSVRPLRRLVMQDLLYTLTLLPMLTVSHTLVLVFTSAIFTFSSAGATIGVIDTFTPVFTVPTTSWTPVSTGTVLGFSQWLSVIGATNTPSAGGQLASGSQSKEAGTKWVGFTVLGVMAGAWAVLA
jgi:hypothetical protein